MLPLLVFVVVSGISSVGAVLDPRAIGSHALLYTDAARAMVNGGNPWTVGPPAAVFAGPPLMLVPFVPFVGLPPDLTRAIWVGAMAIVAALSIRRLGLPAYWIAFPPLFEAILLGHPEPLVLGLLLIPSALSGLAVLIKPYAVLPMIAMTRWSALVLAALVLVLSVAVLPWSLFVRELPGIAENLARQSHGDAVVGSPALLVIAVVLLLLVGWRRALWLATPLVWPNAQPMYKVASIPALSPMLATIWAVPIPGLTLLGLAIEVACVVVSSRRGLPSWLAAGLARPGAAVAITDRHPAAANQPIQAMGALTP